jgi:hypothetical protein
MCSLMGHLGAVIIHIYCHCSLFCTFAHHLCLTPPCSGIDSTQLFSPNIWCTLRSKPEDNPDKATKTSQSTSPSRRRPTPDLCPKPNPPPAPIHSGPLHHHRGLRALNLRQHPESPATSTSQYLHHHNKLQPEW